MDDKNQNTGLTVDDGGVREAPILSSAANGFSNLEAEALSADPNSLPQISENTQSAAPPQSAWRRLLRRADLVLLALIIIGGLILVLTATTHKTPTNKQANVASQYDTQQISLDGFIANSEGIAFGPSNVLINGSLTLNNGVVITPSVQPNAATAGQLYYDQNTNQLAYYNGTVFVPLSASGAVVQSIGGISGQLTLGGGLSVVGNQLTATQAAGVSSFGGRTGAITVGGGLNLVGNALQNTGVLNVLAGSNISVTDDGNGNFTVNNIGAGTGTVTSSGGATGALAMFTGSQNIEDSLVTQSGTTVTITGDLNVVTGGLSLGNPLTVSNGGTGTTSLAANGVLVAAGTAPFASVVAGSPGLCFVSTAGAPTFAACPSSSGVTSLNGLGGALSLANASAAGSTITIDNAGIGTKGIASFNGTNFSASSGAINTIQDINTAAAPTFGRLSLSSSQATNAMLVINNTNGAGSGNLLDLQLNGSSKFSVQPNGNTAVAGTINGQTISSTANFTGSLGVTGATTISGILSANGGTINSSGALNITPGGVLTVGATGQTLALQGNSSSSFAVTNGGNTTTLNFQAPTATVTYRLAAAANGNYDLCSTAGNCAGVGGGVTTAGGTTNRLAKFTSSQGIGDSSISDNGTTVTSTANLVVQGGQTTIGVANSQSGSLTLAYGSANFSGTIVQGALATASRTYTLPDFDGTVCLSSGNCLGGGGGGANTALSNLSSVAINTSLLPGTTSIDLGSGAAPFRELYVAGTSLTPGTNNFKITGASTGGTRTITLPDSSGTVCLNNSTNCGFLTGAGTAFVQNGNTLGVAANLGTNDGFALNLRTNGSTRLGIDATTGNVNLTGDLAIDGGDLTAAAGLNITPGGTLTAGSTTQVFTLQGSNTSTITATNGANTTTVSFQSPTANVNYRFPTAPANTYDICTTVGNCAGSGTGVTTAGGTTGTIPVFTASQAVGDSLLSQSGSTVTTNGNFNLASGNFYKINNTQISSANLSNDANLAKLNASQTFTGNTVAFQNGSNSVNAFNVQNAIGSRILTVDTTGGQVLLGLASTLDGKLVFNNVSNANKVTILPGTPTADRTLTLPDASGILCTDSGNCAGAGATLQTGYNFSVAGAPRIKVNSTLLGVDIQDADSTIGANLFNVRASNVGGLGSVLFGVGNTGQITFQNSANSTTALNVLTQGSTRVLTVDTTNGQTILGQSTTLDGKLVFNNASNSNQIVLTTAAASGPQTITLPNATGTVCLTIGNCTGAGSSNTLQAAYDAGATITTSNARDLSVTLNDTATDSNFLVNLQCTTTCGGNGRFAVQNTGVDVFHISPNGGATLFQPTTDTTSAFNIKTSLGNNMFTIDTVNTRVGIGLGSSNVPTLTGRGAELSGALRLSGSGSVYDGYVTPNGGSVDSRINVVNSVLAGNTQVIALGVTSTSNVTARGISVFDARTVAHQPSIGVFSPDENNIVGFSWNGTNTTANVQTTDHTTGSSTEVIVLQSGNVSGGNGSSGDARVNTGSITGGTGGTSGNIYIVSGDGLGTNSSSGNITVDSGAKSGSGTSGSILIGTTNASALTVGRSGLTTSNAGGLTVAQLLTIPTLGSADTATYLCRNSLNQIASCNTTGTGAAFVQGGNSFGATAVLGTNDGFDLNIRTAGNTVATFSGTNGSAIFKNSTNSATAFQIQDSGAASQLTVNTLTRTGGVAGNLIKVGDSTGTDTAITILQLDAASADPTTNLAALNGGLFYNSNTNKVSLIENGQVKIICNTTDLGCGTGTVTLQGAYTNSTGGSTSEIITDATRGALDIQDRSTSNGGTIGANLLNVRATAATDTTAGTLMLSVGNTGAVLLQNSVNSANALQVKNALGTATAFDVDTTNTRIGIGTAAPARTLDIATSDSNTTAPALRLLQGGSGDATVELKNSVSAFFAGVDTSDSSLFKISSSNASGATSKFGYTASTWNNTYDNGNNNMISATKVTSGGSAGTLNSISVYVGKLGGAGQMQVALYTNKTTGCVGGHTNCPNTLVASGATYNLTQFSWNTIPLSAAVSASTIYWLAFNVDSGSTQYGVASGLGSDETAYYQNNPGTTTFGSWPASVTTADSEGGTPYRIYATYTTTTTDSFASNLFSLSADGAATFKNTTDSNQAFQVKNSSNSSVLTVDTLNNDSGVNLISDGGFEKGVTGWTIKDSGNGPDQRTDQHHSGHAALYVEGGNAVGGGGVKYDITLTDALEYIATFYVKESTTDSPATTIEAGYNNGSSNTACTQNTNIANSLGWTRIECTIKTPGSHSGTPHFYIRRTDQNTSDLFIDDVFLSSDYSSLSMDSMRNGGVDFQGVVQSDLRLQGSVNSTTALTVQNQYANSILNVDTTDPNNLILNPSFEKDLTSGLSVFDTWGATGAGTTVSRDTSQAYIGTASLKIVTGATASAGTTLPTHNTYPTQLLASNTYTMSWYAKLSSGTFTDIKAGYARDGATWIDCIPNSQTVATGGWTRFSCTFNTIATLPNNNAAIRIIQTAGSAHTFWIDGLRLEKGSVANAYGNGSISLDGNITSALSLHNTSDSTTAFLIQNAAGSNIFDVDTLNTTITLGNSGNTLTLSASGGIVAAGTARHSKTILLMPEYAGAVLDAQSDATCSAAFSGTMTSAYDNTNRMNNYNWTAALGSAQCYDVVVQVPIPNDFSAWSGNPDIEMQKDSTGTAAYALQITPTSGNDANFSPAGAYVTMGSLTTSWTNIATSPLSGTYTAGTYMTIKVRLTSTSGANVKLGNIKLVYLSSF